MRKWQRRLLRLYRLCVLILLVAAVCAAAAGLLYVLARCWLPYSAVAAFVLMIAFAVWIVISEIRSRKQRRQAREQEAKKQEQHLEEALRVLPLLAQRFPMLLPQEDGGFTLPFHASDCAVSINADSNGIWFSAAYDDYQLLVDRPPLLEAACETIQAILDGELVVMRDNISADRLVEAEEIDHRCSRLSAPPTRRERFFSALFLTSLDAPPAPTQLHIFTYDGSGDRTVPFSPP